MESFSSFLKRNMLSCSNGFTLDMSLGGGKGLVDLLQLIGEVEFLVIAQLLECWQASEVDHRRWSTHDGDCVG